MRSGQRSSRSSIEFAVDPKYDTKGRPRVDQQEFRDRLVESGVVKKQLIPKRKSSNSGSNERAIPN